jgi:hypothetical protein
MHDPKTVAFEIYLGKKQKKDGNYRTPLITIWHNDPEKDRTDDSCGLFIRARHFDKKIVDQTVKEFESEWDNTFKSDSGYIYNTGWFNPQGENSLSVRGIVLNMYIYAAKICLNPNNNHSPSKMWKKAFKFVNNNYTEIMYFAENNRDSIRDTIVRKFEIGCNVEYTPEKRKEMIKECASIICADIMRRNRKWYQHPKWHIHHWSIQFHPFRKLKRRFWDKCSKCGQRGFKGNVMGNWDGDLIWHEECDKSCNSPVELKQ